MRVLLLLECSETYLEMLQVSAEHSIDNGGPIEAFYTLAVNGRPCNLATDSPPLVVEERIAKAACAIKECAA